MGNYVEGYLKTYNRVRATQNSLQLMISKKNMAVGIILAVFFGPLGLLYTDVKKGLILFGAAIVISILNFLIPFIGLINFGIWILSIVWQYQNITKINAEADMQFAEMMSKTSKPAEPVATPVTEVKEESAE